jgi:hypothetical protein
MNNRELVIRLIREELRNQFLINSLESLGFDCSSFSVNITEVVFVLAGFQDDPDELYNRYYDMMDNVLENATMDNLDKMLDTWSMDIYIGLLETKLNEMAPVM